MNIVPDGSTDGLLSALLIVIPALVVLWHRRTAAPLPVGGLAAIAVSVVALVVRAGRVGPSAGELPFDIGLVSVLAIGSGLALAGGMFAVRMSLSPVWRIAAVVPGALVAVWGSWSGGGAWIPIVAMTSIAIAGPAADAVDHRLGLDGMTMSMLAVSAVGVLVTLPETQHVAPVAGALLVLAVLGWPLGLVRLGAGGGCAAVCILAVLTVDGGVVRDGAVIGGLAAPGLLAGLVFHTGFEDGEPSRLAWSVTVRLLILHTLVTLAVVRVSGLRDDAWEAAFLAALFVAVGVVAAGPILSSSGPLRHRTR